ncbi:hypothetical protein SDC9_184878 [bioreactor metagenome]|uniref:Uncharacterized protein n=1 Tax=bioreactor metagenome TaxID=1076179 RepID=A0A645HEB7_9ZZZZ
MLTSGVMLAFGSGVTCGTSPTTGGMLSVGAAFGSGVGVAFGPCPEAVALTIGVGVAEVSSPPARLAAAFSPG